MLKNDLNVSVCDRGKDVMEKNTPLYFAVSFNSCYLVLSRPTDTTGLENNTTPSTLAFNNNDFQGPKRKGSIK